MAWGDDDEGGEPEDADTRLEYLAIAALVALAILAAIRSFSIWG